MNERDVIDDRANSATTEPSIFPLCPCGAKSRSFHPRSESILKRLDVLAEVARLPVPLHQLRLKSNKSMWLARPP